jgi:hypothetical protein
MKKLLLLVLLSLPLMAQSERFHLHDFGILHEDREARVSNFFYMGRIVNVYYRVDRDDSGLKTLTIYPEQIQIVWDPRLGVPSPQDVHLTQSQAYDMGIVQALVGAFRAAYADDVPLKIVYAYGALETAARQLVVLDGKSNNRIVSINLSTFTPKYSADLDSLRATFGLRPSATGNSTEAWVPTFKVGTGAQMSVVNLVSGAVETKIPTPVDGSPQTVVFSNSGNTVFETVSLPESGGALVVFDAATRTVKNTVPFPFPPTGTLMAPDGSTLYVIGSGPTGRYQILYYDVLSGTADLTVTLPFADNLFSPYAMHPNGKIYGQNSGKVFVYDPQARKVVSKFDLGLAANRFLLNMQLSPDGRQLYALDDSVLKTPASPGNIYLLDAITGYNLGSLPIGGTANVFFVAPSPQ